jgi:hypothetical protein
MIVDYNEYIWGDKFKNLLLNNKKIYYSNIDDVKLKNLDAEFIVTHNGDNPVDDSVISFFKNLKIWFGQNILTKDARVFPLPIGLENDYINGQPQRKQILYEKSNLNKQATKLVYLNCSIGTYRQDRQSAYDYFCNKNWCTVKPHGSLDYYGYTDDILNHHFSICPRGNGLDCHRNWEVLYLNRYPIMKRYYGLEKLYSDLPVIFVDNWSDVTEEFLINSLNKIKLQNFNYEKLKFNYWKSLIENV